MTCEVGVPWFLPEDYGDVRERLGDGQQFPECYGDWLAASMAACAVYEAQGCCVTRVRIEPGLFLRWCAERLCRSDHHARQAFIREMLARQQRPEGTAGATSLLQPWPAAG